MHPSNLLSNLRILYIEDDKNTQEEVAFFLEPMCEMLYLASNGKEGYELYLLHQPDLIITDIQMPIMNGIDMIKKIRHHDTQTPIFITTAYNETNHLLNAINSGVDRYILKPINFKTLIETMTEFLSHTDSKRCFVSIDKHGYIIDASPNWLSLTGFSFSEINHTSLKSYLNTKNVDILGQILENTSSTLDKQTILLDRKNSTTVEVVMHTVISDGSHIELEFKTLNSYITEEARLNKTLESERFIKELIKMNSTIYKEVSRANSKKTFLENLTKHFTNHELFEFSYVTCADNFDMVTIIEQGKHPTIDIKSLFPEPVALKEIQCPMFEAIQNLDIVLVEDLNFFSEFNTKSYWLSHKIQSILILPLHKKSHLYKRGSFCIMLNKTFHLNDEVLELTQNITEALNMGLQSIEDKHEREKLELQLREELSERKKNEEIIRQLAFYDPLTLLPNRRLFSDFLNKTVAFNKRQNCYSALFFLDLDNFKPLNDVYGHAIGDLLLIDAAIRIKNTLRESDVVARFGGDEFVVVAQDLGENYTSAITHAHIAAEKIRSTLSEPYKLPISNSENSYITHHCTSSIGVTLFAHEGDENTLIKQADSAMYHAKESGKNQIAFFKE